MSAENVSVNLTTLDDYMKFYPFMEMIARENFEEGHGKMFTPKLEVQLNGLQKDALYEILFSIERYDNIRYTCSDGTWKESTKRKNKIVHDQYKKMSLGKKLGADWMNGAVSFDEVRITNRANHENENKLFYVTPMYKYVPVLEFVNLTSPNDTFKYPIEHAQFIPVTGYQSKEISTWKSAMNKFTTAKNGGTGKPLKRKSQKNEKDGPVVKRVALSERTPSPASLSLPASPASSSQGSVSCDQIDNDFISIVKKLEVIPGSENVFLKPSTSSVEKEKEKEKEKEPTEVDFLKLFYQFFNTNFPNTPLSQPPSPTYESLDRNSNQFGNWMSPDMPGCSNNYAAFNFHQFANCISNNKPLLFNPTMIPSFGFLGMIQNQGGQSGKEALK